MRCGIVRRHSCEHPGRPQILLHRQVRKDLAALRHVSDADPGALFGAALQQIDSVESDAAGSRRQQAHDAFEQRRLAHAIAAHQAHERAGGHGKIDIPQGVAAAVELIEAFDRQHASRSEINFDDARIILHLIHVAFGDARVLRAAR